MKLKKLISQLRLKTYKLFLGKNCYGQFIGALNFWQLLVWNLLYPGRFFNQLKFGQVKFFNIIKNKSNLNKFEDENSKNAFKDLNDHGSATIKNFFSIKQINQFKSSYKNEIEKLKSRKVTQNSYIKDIGITLKPELIPLWLDEKIIFILERYMRSKIYARTYVNMNYSIGINQVNSRMFFDGYKSKCSDTWHVDHSTLISLHIFLDDVDEDGTCMKFIKGSHKFLNSNLELSDESVKDKKLEIGRCHGPSGTVNIHCGNVIHKMRPKENSNRLMLTCGFTSGSNIMLDTNKILKSLSGGFEIDQLDEKKREIIRGIFPKKLTKGYDFLNNNLKPTSFKGI